MARILFYGLAVLLLVLVIVGAAYGEETRRVVQASEVLAKIEAGQPVEYDHVVIKGDLNLSQLNLTKKPIDWISNDAASLRFFDNLVPINSSIIITNSEIDGNVNFQNSLFLGPVCFTGTIFNSTGDHNKSLNFITRLSFSILPLTGLSYLEKSKTQNLNYSRDTFDNSHFQDLVYFNGVQFKGDASFSGTQFRKGALFIKARFTHKAEFSKAQFNSDSYFSDSQFDEEIYFRGSKLENASFTGSIFNDNAFFDKAMFKGYTYFDKSKFNWYALFNESQLDNADFVGAIFNNIAYFEEANFSGDAYFKGTHFDKSAIFKRAHFINIADFSECMFNNNANFESAIFDSFASFRETQFNEGISFHYSQFNGNPYSWEPKLGGIVDFSYAQLNGSVHFIDVQFSGHANFYNTKFIGYILYWDSIKNAFNSDEPTWLSLIKNFKDHGQFSDADDCYYQYMDWKREKNSGLFKFFDDFACLSCGYGVRPLYPIYWCIMFIFIFGIIYWRYEAIQRSNKSYYSVIYAPGYTNKPNSLHDKYIEGLPQEIHRIFSNKSNLSFRDALYFSSMIFFVSHPPTDWKPSDKWKYLVMVEDILGWLLLTLFVVTLTHVMIRS